MIKRGPYKTKGRKQEFNRVYAEISDINRSLHKLKTELECFVKNGNWDEAISRQETICKGKIRLFELAKKGWDIETENYPTLV